MQSSNSESDIEISEPMPGISPEVPAHPKEKSLPVPVHPVDTSLPVPVHPVDTSLPVPVHPVDTSQLHAHETCLENLMANKVNKSTSTEMEESEELKCKYCVIRLSKLRKLEKLAAHTITPRSPYSSQSLKTTSNIKKERGSQTSAALFERAEMTNRELRSLAMILRFQDGKPMRTETYCKCVMYGKERDCKCGEEDSYFEWVWEPNTKHRGQATNLQEKFRHVIFHKDYSCGTTAVRGELPMDKDQYFWEIKMTTPVYGTDMMVGVGTANVDQNKYHNMFCSMLGCDMDSWGLSYDGRIQHGGRKSEYCSRFGQGAIIGMHLDMWHGTLAFFKNRHNLGIAFRNLQGRTLYPMACSTAARSGMRVISSRSFPTSLQFLCCQKLRKFVPPHLSVLDALTMPPGLRAFLANNMTWLLDVPHSAPESRSRYICDICMPLKGVFEGYTDEEDSSDDDCKIDHVHDVLNLADSDDDSYDEDSDGIDRRSQSRSMNAFPVRLGKRYWPTVATITSTSTPSEPEPRRNIIMSRTLSGVKKFRLDSSLDSADGPSEDLEEDDSEEEDNVHQTEESQDGDRDIDKPLNQLGKRKRS
ncbi:SPRY domain-containing SOCS box protein 3 [Biomphalaria pfeifferi]|uniref:SPRY domain-containing SOCS box protein 3 n=1 Tax=Biomphalaria pfeifferi TaxID=112525 RepID=A0AAD8BQF8_BIOPF|nr:SPRY domain-containing SOCS box protein 3 [Biomphalaria pfeifferi]